MKASFEIVRAWAGAHDWAPALAGFAVKSTMVLLGVWLLLQVWRKASAALRHWIWLLALISLFLLPLRPPKFSGWSVALWSRSPEIEHKNEIASVVGEISGRSLATSHAPVASGENSKIPGTSVKDPVSFASDIHVSSALALLWLTGFALLFIRILMAQWNVHCLEKTAGRISDEHFCSVLQKVRDELGLRREVRLFQSLDSVLPMTWGVWRPVVLLPDEAKSWSIERLQIVLRHELAHVKRWDCLTQVIAQLACAFCWFNPLAWLAARQMCIKRERACDDLVLGSGAAPSSHAEHLLEIARSFSVGSLASSAAIAMARPPQIAERIAAIVDARRNRRRVTLLMSVFTIFAVTVLIGMLSLFHLQAQSADAAKAKALAAKFDRLKPFFAAKEKQARTLVKQETNTPSPLIMAYFAAAAKSDWASATNIYWQMRRRAYQFEGVDPDPHLETMAWQPVNETYGILEHFAFGEEKYVLAYGNDIIDSIPAGSIYFGGTDPGRWIITGMSKSHENADPFFTLSQNPLADGLYLRYLRTMYGGKIYIPTDEESKTAFAQYTEDARARMSKGQLRPGEDVRMVDGKPKVSGQVAVMAINALLAKKIFDKNPDREFYIEESFPLDWMYPYLTPNGLIMKINRQQLSEIPDDVRQKDHAYWRRYTAPIIGDWLKEGTPVAEICERAEKVFSRKDFSGYGGDPKFLANDYCCKKFSKLRASIGGVYAWRANQLNPVLGNALGNRANNRFQAEADRMTKEADFAFRQAYALCPYSPETLYRYVQLLVSNSRFDDAILLARTSSKLGPSNGQFQMLLAELEKMRAQSRPAAGARIEADAELQTLEAEYRANPLSVAVATKLAQKYSALGRTDDVMRIADAFVAHPKADAAGISFAAQIYQQLPSYPKLETALARWVQLTPTPEAWLDYAASQAVQQKESETLVSLQQALTLNAARLKKDPNAEDIQAGLKKDPRFVSLRANADFQKLVAPDK
jgi:beta-lactamase regulating signal transducer with metallopeptidase domain